MKKILLTLSIYLYFSCFCITSIACVPYIPSNYDSYISYEFYSLRGNTLNVTKEFTYDFITQPPSSMKWSQTTNNILYSGTLTLKSYYYSNGKTIATYTGILTAQ